MLTQKLKKFLKVILVGIAISITLTGIIQGTFFNQATSNNNLLLSSYGSDSYVKYEPEKSHPIDEAAVRQILYINPQNPKATDDNIGTESLPLKTLAKAAELALKNYQNQIGTKVILYPGIYRESIRLTSENKDGNSPLIFEAKEPGSVIISGSDIWQDWQADPKTPIYTHFWPYAWGVTANSWPDQIEVAPIVRRKEMIFVNGTLLTQKLSLSELIPGTFFVSEAEHQVYIYPESGNDLKKSLVEVATRETLIFSEKINNLVIRGLQFQHAASYFRDAAVTLRSGHNILVEDSQFVWNNWHGLHFRFCDQIIARKIVANYNGQRGVGGFNLRNVLYEDVESSYNNWRGAWGEFYDFDAGQKFFGLRNATFRRYKAVGNMASGLWLDFDNAGVWIDDSYICNNLEVALYIEASHHILVTNSTICNNRATPKSLYPHPGILGATSNYVTLENNILCGNERSQLKILVRKPREVTNWETKEKYFLISDHWTLKNNIIVGKDASQLLIYLQPNGQDFIDTLASDNNIWYNPEKQQVFQIDETLHPWGTKDFPGWQLVSSQDKNSVFASPGPDFHCGETIPTRSH